MKTWYEKYYGKSEPLKLEPPVKEMKKGRGRPKKEKSAKVIDISKLMSFAQKERIKKPVPEPKIREKKEPNPKKIKVKSVFDLNSAREYLKSIKQK